MGCVTRIGVLNYPTVMKIVIFLGAPGSGKGTIANRLAKAHAACHVSSGDLLRDAVRRHTPAGVEAECYMHRGELVPDAIIGQMIGDYLDGVTDGRTVLLDGFPRTVAQAKILDAVTEHRDAELAAVVLLDVPDEIIVERIAGRRGCPKCGTGYHVKNIPPRVEGICDKCGAELVIRKDDNAETLNRRLAVYRAQTVPLVEFYSERGLLHRVDGVGLIEDIVRATRRAWA